MSEHQGDDRDRPADPAPGKTAAPDDREARLAAALRANLRRRKAVSREAESKAGRQD
jgi:hypothetical protein